jgi:hypothetical protein
MINYLQFLLLFLKADPNSVAVAALAPHLCKSHSWHSWGKPWPQCLTQARPNQGRLFFVSRGVAPALKAAVKTIKKGGNTSMYHSFHLRDLNALPCRIVCWCHSRLVFVSRDVKWDFLPCSRCQTPADGFVVFHLHS